MSIPAEFVLPGPTSITKVLGGAAAACGIAGDEAWAGWAEDLSFPSAPRVCVVLVDGLGLAQLRERSGHFPFLRRREVRELTTVAPSTTAAAVTAIGTGALPGATGMLGYTVRDPGTGQLMNMIKWDHDITTPRQWQTVPTIAERAINSERLVAIGAPRFVGSGLNTAALRSFRDISAETLAQRVEAAAHALRSGTADLVYLYWGELDHVGHVHGWNSWEWGEQASSVDHELGNLVRRLPRGTLVVITADHGMIDVSERIDVAATPALGQDVYAIAGEPRATHVFTDHPGRVAERWRDYLGERAWVVTRSQAAEVIGGVEARFLPAVGDVVVFARGRTAVVDSASQSPGSIALVGVHGSLTAAEMLVPCASEVT